MTANELRIGNLFILPNGEIGKISYHEIRLMVVAIEKPNYQPIQLTEEWLLKLRFVKHHKYGYFYIDSFIVDLDMNGQFYMCDIDIHIVLKHVHQLQNLYFALTGEELTFKSE